MSYQEERLQEIADAIREVKGTTEKIPATNFASEIVGLSVVKPSGIKTITENGDYDVKDFAWASVKVEADLNERVIIGKWSNGADTIINFQKNGILSVDMAGNSIDGTYTINNLEITITIMGVDEILVYNDEDDFLYFKQDVSQTQKFTRLGTNLITKEITENGTYKASDDGADGYSEVVVNVSGGGGKPSPFADATPEEIQQIGNEISAKGMTSAEVEATYGWKIGDIKDITLTTGEVIQMRIIGFNHDDLTGGGKAGITLNMVNCLNTKYQMNRTNTNTGGWGASQFRNTTLPIIKATLPTEWQDIIVKVDKKSAKNGGLSSTPTETLSDDLFLLAGVEIFGTESSYGYAKNGSEEGTQYEYWQGKPSSNRIKNANGQATWWWERSPSGSDKTSFCDVDKSGGAVYEAANNNNGISFAFCVGSKPVPVVAGLPIELSTDTDMTNALVEDNLGKVYKFTGTSDTYETDGIYIVSEVE